MSDDKAIRAAKLTLGALLDKRRAKEAKDRAGGQIAPSKYLPDVPRQAHASGGYVPAANLPVPRRLATAAPLQTGSAQPTALEALAGLAGAANKIGDTATGLFGKEEEKASAPAPQPAPSADHGGMSEAALAAWGRLTDAWGQPLTVNSAYRDPKRNEEVGGAKGSQHMHGNAYDIDASGLSYEDRLRLADAAWEAGFRGIGFYDNALHFDVADPRAWGPSYSRDSIPDWARDWANQRYGYADGGAVAGGYTPQRTVKAYKLFRRKGAQLMPLFVHADKPVPIGQWLEAEEGPQGKTAGKVKSKLGDLAYRPGWHAGDLPIATHIGGKSSPDLKKPDYRPDDQVWAEIEMAADKDWQSVADSRGKGVKAHITDQVPLGGFYRYKTNPNMTGNWLIGGHMKVNRVLSDDEVKQINAAAGTADLPRRQAFAAGGAVPAMFEGMHEDLLGDDGKPMDLWHGTPHPEEFEAFDDAKIGSNTDHGWRGRGHYLTPEEGLADAYADPDMIGEGTVIGPLHAALKNPYIWDTSSDNAAHRTLRDLQSMGLMTGQGKLEPHHIIEGRDMDQFMQHMQERGHDGVLVKTKDHSGKRPHQITEVVVFKPNAIKHKEAEVFDPTDPRIRRASGGAAYDAAMAAIRRTT
jgi:hypothetical protein